jgi:hypothetical protein
MNALYVRRRTPMARRPTPPEDRMSIEKRHEANVRALARIELIAKHPRLSSAERDALLTDEVLAKWRDKYRRLSAASSDVGGVD